MFANVFFFVVISVAVEDHFAKALGETWVKLQAKAEQEAKAKAETKVTSTTSESRLIVK